MRYGKFLRYGLALLVVLAVLYVVMNPKVLERFNDAPCPPRNNCAPYRDANGDCQYTCGEWQIAAYGAKGHN